MCISAVKITIGGASPLLFSVYTLLTVVRVARFVISVYPFNSLLINVEKKGHHMKKLSLYISLVFASILSCSLASAETNSANIARSQFTSAVISREPVDNIEILRNDVSTIYFFTELHNLEGQTITHRWEYQGATMAEVAFQVSAQRWRAWSNKQFSPQQTGEWKVSIVDQAGN